MAFQQNIFRPTTAMIHLDHLAENVKQLQTSFGENNFFCPMVKANAYGHGDVEVALRLEKEGVKTMGVGLVEEGLLLRQMGCQTELLVFGIFDQEAAFEVVKWRLTPVLNLWNQFEDLEKVLLSFGKEHLPLPIHIKFDTGMHRLGFDWKEADKIFQFLESKKNIFKVKGILTHLHSGEDASDSAGKSFEQLRKFLEVETIFSSLNPISHTLNSAGLLNFIQMKKNSFSGLPGISLNQGVRPGLAVYGYSPLKESILGINLKPVMSLRSHVVRYHELQVGEGTSYGHTWKAGRKSIVGVVPIGYADGYHRILSNQGAVLFEGQKVPIVGNVCMDYLMIDVTDVIRGRDRDLFYESEVTLFGYDESGNLLAANEVATKAKTIPWEVLTSVGERVPRVYLEKSAGKENPLYDSANR